MTFATVILLWLILPILLAALWTAYVYMDWPVLTRKIDWCLLCIGRAIGLHLIPKRHKRLAHGGILMLIAYDLLHAGAKIADLGFLFLSLLIEAEDGIKEKADPPAWRSWYCAFSTTPALQHAIAQLTFPSCTLPALRAVFKDLGYCEIPWSAVVSKFGAPDDEPIDLTGAVSSFYIRSWSLNPTTPINAHPYFVLHELAHILGHGPAIPRLYGEYTAETIVAAVLRHWRIHNAVSALYLRDVTPQIPAEAKRMIDDHAADVAEEIIRKIAREGCHVTQ